MNGAARTETDNQHGMYSQLQQLRLLALDRILEYQETGEGENVPSILRSCGFDTSITFDRLKRLASLYEITVSEQEKLRMGEKVEKVLILPSGRTIKSRITSL